MKASVVGVVCSVSFPVLSSSFFFLLSVLVAHYGFRISGFTHTPNAPMERHVHTQRPSRMGGG